MLNPDSGDGPILNPPRWRPLAPWGHLRRRARLLADIRNHFARTGVLEVETPLLSPAGSTDPALASFSLFATDGRQWWLQTSPEFAMKRLLAAGSGDIFQICHAFRQEEQSRRHQSEFTLLEWYRVGLDHHGLMDDMLALLKAVEFPLAVERHTWSALCRQHLDFDPALAETSTLAEFARAHGAVVPEATPDRPLLLDWIYGCALLPRLPLDRAFFIHDFPREQAAYARVNPASPWLAERFELVVGETELANGFHEVTDAVEQRTRQLAENARRADAGLPEMPLDEHLLAALEAGLPPCAGVALGVERLLMVLLGVDDIHEVIAFDDGRAHD
jgi:lysyl-tRNA synthetase class 2